MDGKIIIAGARSYGYPDTSPLIIRLNSDGQLDASFNNSGYYLIPWELPSSGYPEDVTKVLPLDNNTWVVNNTANFTLIYLTALQQTPTAGALNFDGVDDEVELGNWFNYQQFTIEMWVNPAASQSPYANIIDNNHSASTNWVLQQNGGNHNSYYFALSGTPAAVSFSLTANTWQHLSIVRDANSLKVFLNGTEMGSYPYSGNILYNGAQYVRLGNWGNGGRPWNGSMDEVRFWNRPLTQAEIQDRMSCELAPAQTDLLAYYKFNQGFSNCNNDEEITLTDFSGNNHSGDLLSFSRAGTSSNWITGNVTGTCGQLNTYYEDADSDGFGNAAVTIEASTAPEGYVSNSTDCDDTKASVYPGATEICNGIDDNCDGQIDITIPGGAKLNMPFTGNASDISGNGNNGTVNNATLATDRFGNANAAFSFSGNNSFINLPATSLQYDAYSYSLWCRPTVIIPSDVTQGVLLAIGGQLGDQALVLTDFSDPGTDGFGMLSYSTVSPPAAQCYAGSLPAISQWYHVVGTRDNTELKVYVNNVLVCTSPTRASATYNGAPQFAQIGARGQFNQNFTGDIDDVLIYDRALTPEEVGTLYTAQTTFYQDADGDGFGSIALTTQACAAPAGYVTDNTDCNDDPGSGGAGIYPGATEICNGIDDNCDGLTDEGVTTTFYQDADGDGFGNATITTQACTAPAGYVTDNTDCNDDPQSGGANIHPGATEVCNGIDDDCDGLNDEGVTTTFYQDADGDGFGNTTITTQACTAPAGYVTNNTDCNDNPGAGGAGIYPGATETCNGIDDDCDGQIDEGVTITFYRDADGDGYGNAAVTTQACVAPTGYVTDNTDCNDNPAAGGAGIYPGATETCNGVDDNCNGQIDEGVTTTFYQDADGDGFGNTALTIQACAAPAGYVTDNTDCNDDPGSGGAGVYPGATETCNGIDDDCDGQIDEEVQSIFYQDADGDGFGNTTIITQACTAPAGYVTDNTDCNDDAGAGGVGIYPGAIETCNGIDDDCDGQIDEGVTTIFYQDADGDGFGNTAVTTQACAAPAGYVTDNTDCNDDPQSGGANIHPGAPEICNGIDDDCDGLIDEGVKTTFYRDADGDTYGNAAVTVQACTAPTGYVNNSTDCNDDPLAGGATIYPGATETCNGVDDDCDGLIDEGVKTTFYRDADGDTYGNAAVTVQTCTAPLGYVNNSTDCNDDPLAGGATIYPGAVETCGNGIDDNCNAQVDENCISNKMYRSKQSGNWNDNTTWESSLDGFNWTAAAATPTSSDGSITVRSFHNVEVTFPVSIDQVMVEEKGNLRVTSVVTIFNGPGEDLIVNGGLALSGNFSTNRLQGGGNVIINGWFSWTDGIILTPIIINESAVLALDNSATSFTFSSVRLSSSITNYGRISLNAYRDLYIGLLNGFINNYGTFECRGISRSNITNTTGVNGFLNAPSGILTINGRTTINVDFNNQGLIKGVGNVNFATVNNTGILSPGLGNSNSGNLEINSNNNLLSPTSELKIKIRKNGNNPSTSDQLRRDANLVLNGKLSVTEIGKVPNGSYEIIRLSTGSITGNFSTLQLPPGYSLRIQNNSRLWLDKTTILTRMQNDVPITKQSLKEDVEAAIVLSPNPADHILNLRLTGNWTKGNIKINLVDNTGRLIKQWLNKYDLKANTIILKTAEFSNGLYFLIIKDGGGNMITKKLMIQH